MSRKILYQIPMSPPVRSVQIVAKVIGVKLEERFLNIYKREHLQSEFIKINPHHTVPTLDDDGTIIWDSHAICIYLMDKYAPECQIYPKNPSQRAIINQRLFFDASILFPSLMNYAKWITMAGMCEPTEKMVADISSSYELINVLFLDNSFLVGNEVTLADYVCITTITQLDILYPIDDEIYPKIRPWINRMIENIPNYQKLNGNQLELFRTKIEESKIKNKLDQNGRK